MGSLAQHLSRHPPRIARRHGLYIRANGLMLIYIAVFALLSWPLSFIGDWYFFEYIVHFIDATDPQYYVNLAGKITFGTYVFFLIFYWMSRIPRLERRYADRALTCGGTVVTHGIFWMATSACLVLLVLYFFMQSGWRVPIVDSIGLSHDDYNIMRGQVGARVNQSLFQFALTLLSPINLLSAIYGVRKRFTLFISLGLFLTVGAFSLARSSLAVGMIVLLLSVVLTRPLRAGKLLMYGGFVLIVLLGASLNSLRGLDANKAIVERVVHGQWVAFPLYLWYFETEKAPVNTILHPAMRSILGETQRPSPARELMIATHPEAVESGGAGTMPTFFSAEAFAVFGVWGLLLAPLIVCAEWLLVNWLFARLQKNPITIVFYAWAIYKLTSGVLLGVSMFIFSMFPLILLGLLMYVLIRDTRRLAQRSQPKGARSIEALVH